MSTITIKKEDPRKSNPNNEGLSHLEKREFGKLEKEISNLEKKRSDIESLFSSGSLTPEKINETSSQLEQIISDLELKEERWLELSMKMEE